MYKQFTPTEIKHIQENSAIPWFTAYMALKIPTVQFMLHMDVTNSCSYNCDICYKKSGSDRFDLNHFKTIISEASTNPRVARDSFCITGGEPMDFYTRFKVDDLKHMMQHSLDNGFAIGLKTNAGWTLKPESNRIWQDIENLNLYDTKLRIDLSLSPWHRDAVKTTNNVLQYVCHSDKLKQNTKFDLLVTGNNDSNLETVLSESNLTSLGLQLNYRIPKSERSEECLINQTRVNLSTKGKIVRVENAEKNNLGTPDKTHNLTLVNMGVIVLWYDHNKNVHIGNKHKPYFTTSYLRPNNTVKTVDEISAEFSDMVFIECKSLVLSKIKDKRDIELIKKIQPHHIDEYLGVYEHLR